MPISKDEQKKNFDEMEKLKSQMAQEASNINEVASNVSSGSNIAKNDHSTGDLILKVLIIAQAGALIFFITVYIMLSVGVKLPFFS